MTIITVRLGLGAFTATCVSSKLGKLLLEHCRDGAFELHNTEPEPDHVEVTIYDSGDQVVFEGAGDLKYGYSYPAGKDCQRCRAGTLTMHQSPD